MRELASIALFVSGAFANRNRPGHDEPSCYNPPPPPKTTLTTITTGLPASCSTQPTQTFYSTSGCDLKCSTDFCIFDAAVTIPCGCTSVAIKPTTITICPTKTPCYQCYTGWGTFFVTQTCSSTKPALAAPTPTS